MSIKDIAEACPPTFILYKLLYITKIARISTRERIIPIEITVSRPITKPGNYAAFLGITPQAGATNQIVFSAGDARKPFLTEDSSMWAFFEAGFNLQKSPIIASKSLRERLRAMLLEMLPSGEASAEEASKRLAMSKRSLQRKLQEEGSSFQSILNKTRRELADYYLDTSEITIAEVSYLLAYSDVSSFQRAYKSWSGMSPKMFRSVIAASSE
ncbi:helix-turn-helix transcriptional regulator [Sediminispirochaeta smaragdinae]|uniref:helix-turn-helix transcriptional regulator n=1 Tax=Sediminispirochaeta smaragdinae TaxID=55206 RepID=UPI0002D5840B|nr:AraC family transcriptional regulator [Sediminispirochaeta smaragdinae]